MRREWEYALSLNRPTFVRPTYWEVPLPESPADGLPPDALRRLHFQRIGASIEDQLAPSARQPDTADTADLLSKAMHSPTPKVPDRYEPQRRLGQGAMGSVHLFRDVESGRLVVIKYLDGDRDRTDVQIRFFHEARKRGALQHPNIGTILDDPVHGDSPFIVMEHIQGETLAEVIGRSAPLPIRQKLNILEQLCRGLSHLHRAGVIHRNINPWNLMVDEQGVLKIVGFGIACLSDSDVAEIAGTPSYMAPEQIAGGPVDRRSDLFAAGALAYELLTYRRAFSGASMGSVIDLILHSTPEPIRSVVPEIGADVVAIVTRALEKTPEARYQDAADMERDLQVAIGLRSGSPGVRGSGGQVMNHERPVHLS
jgi:serine/threonine-protein kinase